MEEATNKNLVPTVIFRPIATQPRAFFKQYKKELEKAFRDRLRTPETLELFHSAAWATPLQPMLSALADTASTAKLAELQFQIILHKADEVSAKDIQRLLSILVITRKEWRVVKAFISQLINNTRELMNWLEEYHFEAVRSYAYRSLEEFYGVQLNTKRRVEEVTKRLKQLISALAKESR